MRNKRPSSVSIGIDADASVIERWQRDFPGRCHLIHGDAITYLAEYSFTGQELVYADPPYLPQTRRNPHIYRHEYSEQDHERLLTVLADLPCRVMLSGYDNPMYRERLVGWRRVTFHAKTHVDVREECVWMNFPEVTELHDSSYMGATFRERQTVKRRHQRILDRFEQMGPVERNHILQMLTAQYGSTRSPL